MMYKVTIIRNDEDKTIFLEKGTNLLLGLFENGINLSSSCGGKGKCNKCKVKLLEGKVNIDIENGYFKSCQYFIENDIKIEVNLVKGKGISDFSETQFTIKKDFGYGVAVDLGTTTLAAYLVNLKDGKIIDKSSQLNKQSIYGADVISRIDASNRGHLKNLNNVIIDQIDMILETFCQKHNIKNIKKIVVSGNTTMLHFLKGEDPYSIGVYPFTPKFLDLQILKEECNLKAEETILLPSASAYVGSDIIAGLISSKTIKQQENNLFVDIGTNGEIVLSANEKIFACATAAGPAFEGANIENGIGGIDGAIDHIWYNNGIEYSTIENNSPIGICGSGIVDIISLIKNANVIDETGAFTENNKNKIMNNLKGNKFYINDKIYISQKDIREFQLAKSAIASGIMTLASEAKINLKDIDNVYIAGGFSFYLDINNAINIGIFPIEFVGKIKNIGNASGQGAIMCLTNEKYIINSEKLSKSINIIELGNNFNFMNYFIENMSF